MRRFRALGPLMAQYLGLSYCRESQARGEVPPDAVTFRMPGINGGQTVRVVSHATGEEFDIPLEKA